MGTVHPDNWLLKSNHNSIEKCALDQYTTCQIHVTFLQCWTVNDWSLGKISLYLQLQMLVWEFGIKI